MIVTFYSYKGGVGRTMALSAVAKQLSILHGYKVLAIDWDLEAPGLHFYFNFGDKDLQNQVGLIDLLSNCKFKKQEFKISEYLITLERSQQMGQLSLLTCGRTTPDYMERVATLDWAALYQDRGYEALNDLKQQINNNFDICLIDARAGQSDLNVAPMSQLADLIIMLFTSNDQALQGTAELARRLHKVHVKRRVDQTVPIILVPSRVFPLEPGYQSWLKERAEPIYSRLLRAGVVKTKHQPNGLRQVILPVYPPASFGEQITIFGTEHERSPLAEAYRDLIQLILDHKIDEDILWRPHKFRSSRRRHEEKLLEYRSNLAEAATRGDETRGSVTSLQLARALREFRQLEEAESLALSSLTHLRGRQERSFQPLALHTLGQIAADREDYASALNWYQEALEKLDKHDLTPRAVILHDIGVVHIRLRAFEDAENLIRESLELKQQVGDLQGQAISIHQLGNIEFSRGNSLEKAKSYFLEAIALSEQAHDKLGAAISFHQFGNVLARQKRFDEALSAFDTAAAIHAEEDDLRGAGITFRRRGDMLEQLGRNDEALLAYRAALTSAHRDRDLRNAQVLHRRQGRIFLREGRLTEARAELAAALRLSEGVELKGEILRNLLELAEISIAGAEVGEANGLLDRAATILTSHPDDRIVARLSSLRAAINQTRERPEPEE